MRLLILLLLPFLSFGQYTPEQFGAIGDGRADDTKAVQQALDSAAAYDGSVYMQKWYRITKPVVAYRWDGYRYVQVSIKIYGDATYWDRGLRSKIIVDHKDGFGLGIQLGKGCIIEGIRLEGKYNLPVHELYSPNFKGDTTCRDARFSPYAGIVIDPFGYRPAYDGGYPAMKDWYRGPATNSGSTGLRFKDITVTGFTVGIIVSPNGFTRNAEMLTFDFIRFANCKIGFASCQDQEKNNKLSNVGAWDRIWTLFTWGLYGVGTPGQYSISTVNTAGSVANLVHRNSGGYFPLHMTDIFSESLHSIGTWRTGSGDRLINSSINFIYKEQTNFPPSACNCEGLTIENSQLRYYGRLNEPLLFTGQMTLNNIKGYLPIIHGRSMYDTAYQKGYTVKRFWPGFVTIRNGAAVVPNPSRDTRRIIPNVGDAVVIMHPSSWWYMGTATVVAVGEEDFTIKYAGVADGYYGIGIYKKL